METDDKKNLLAALDKVRAGIEDGSCEGVFLVTTPRDKLSGEGHYVMHVSSDKPQAAQIAVLFLMSHVELLRARIINDRASAILLLQSSPLSGA
jgi:hypothetical protein